MPEPSEHRIVDVMQVEKPFWEIKRLDEMSASEWESLCDGCGKCCMAKLIDDDTDEIHFTTVACRLFDQDKCRCTNYAERQAIVEDCVQLTPENVSEIAWLPATCAYRLVSEGKPLEDWHPLVSGNPRSTIKAGMSMRGRVTISEDGIVHDGEYLDHLVDGEP